MPYIPRLNKYLFSYIPSLNINAKVVPSHCPTINELHLDKIYREEKYSTPLSIYHFCDQILHLPNTCLCFLRNAFVDNYTQDNLIPF